MNEVVAPILSYRHAVDNPFRQGQSGDVRWWQPESNAGEAGWRTLNSKNNRVDFINHLFSETPAFSCPQHSLFTQPELDKNRLYDKWLATMARYNVASEIQALGFEPDIYHKNTTNQAFEYHDWLGYLPV